MNHVTWLETCTTTTAEESELLGICLVGGFLNNWWRRLNIAALSIYPKHSRAVIYLKLSFPDRCFLLLLLGSRPSLIIANPGHLAFHYRHSGRKGRQAQHVHDNTTWHTRSDSQFTDTHTHTHANEILRDAESSCGWKIRWTEQWWGKFVSLVALCYDLVWSLTVYSIHTPVETQIYLTVQSNHPPTTAT